MKKTNFLIGLAAIFGGVLCFFGALLFETGLSDLFISFSGAGVGSGLVMVSKYFYWSSPQNKDRYEALVEAQNIELEDERKQKLRDKSGRYAYLSGLAVISISIVIFYLLGNMGVGIDYKIIVRYLFVYLIFQYAAGVIIFQYLNKKY